MTTYFQFLDWASFVYGNDNSYHIRMSLWTMIGSDDGFDYIMDLLGR